MPNTSVSNDAPGNLVVRNRVVQQLKEETMTQGTENV